ncbi:hypothetical protein [Streptomyces sp. NPDC003487]
MGRVARRRGASVQVSSRLTWTFSARAGRGKAGAAQVSRPRPVTAATRRVSAAVLRAVLTAARARLRPPRVRTARTVRAVRAVRAVPTVRRRHRRRR